MDVFYYWKDYSADVKAGRIGYFRSSRERLAEFQEGRPDRIWVFKTPKGLKGQVQLLGRLVWADTATTGVRREPGQSYIFYDPHHEHSVRFAGSEKPEAIEAATSWVRRHFPGAITGNFQGENGQKALRGPMIDELKRIAAGFESLPFQAAAEV